MIEVRETPVGVIFAVRLSPGSSADRILGEHDGRLKISVSAPPEKGKANSALVDLLARTLGVKKSSVSVVTGTTSRNKEVLVENLTIEDVKKLLG